MRGIHLAVLAGALGAASPSSAAAQTNPPPGVPTTMMPLPDTHGIEPELLCFAVMASQANDAKKAGQPIGMLDSAAGFYAGRLSVGYPNAGVTLRPIVARLLKQFATESADPYKAPCLQRYGVYLTDLMAALQGGQADAK